MKCLILLTLVTAYFVNLTNAVEFKDYDKDDYEESEETYEKSRYKYFSEPKEHDYAKKDSKKYYEDYNEGKEDDHVDYEKKDDKKYYKEYNEGKEADYGEEESMEKTREVTNEKKDDNKYYKDYNQGKESNFGVNLSKMPTEEKAGEVNNERQDPKKFNNNNNEGREAERSIAPQSKANNENRESGTRRYDLKDAKQLFIKFIQDYNKQYKDQQDYNKHYENFVKNLMEIIKLNQQGGDASFEINMFADQGDDEVDDDGGFQ